MHSHEFTIHTDTQHSTHPNISSFRRKHILQCSEYYYNNICPLCILHTTEPNRIELNAWLTICHVTMICASMNRDVAPIPS